MNYLQPELVEQTIRNTRGAIFSVTLEEGTINARLRGEQPWDSNLITVFDIKRGEFRAIDKNKVIALKANRKTFIVSIPL